jgi:hypothetical protein
MKCKQTIKLGVNFKQKDYPQTKDYLNFIIPHVLFISSLTIFSWFSL